MRPDAVRERVPVPALAPPRWAGPAGLSAATSRRCRPCRGVQRNRRGTHDDARRHHVAGKLVADLCVRRSRSRVGGDVTHDERDQLVTLRRPPRRPDPRAGAGTRPPDLAPAPPGSPGSAPGCRCGRCTPGVPSAPPDDVTGPVDDAGAERVRAGSALGQLRAAHVAARATRSPPTYSSPGRSAPVGRSWSSST